MKSIRNKSSRDGFTLIELIMTIVIVSLLAIPLSTFVTEYVRSASRSEDETTAFNLARLEMEKIKNMDYASILPNISLNYEGYPFYVLRMVLYAQGNAVSTESLKHVLVFVLKNGTLQVYSQLTTYIAKNIAYGP